jgi:hypothetical protein
MGRVVPEPFRILKLLAENRDVCPVDKEAKVLV